ncbi:MAG TPA: aminopeptidase P family protein [Bacteroidales bacterium]|nr:aminopeptidase P family protein [Bacteroidales bacterium]
MISVAASKIFKNHREHFVKLTEPLSIAVFSSSAPAASVGEECHPMIAAADFYYLTGIRAPQCLLVLAPDHPEPRRREVLFVSEPTQKEIVWGSDKISLSDAATISGIEEIHSLNEAEGMLAEYFAWCRQVYLNVPEHQPAAIFEGALQRTTELLLMQRYPVHHYLRAAPLITKLRMVKDSAEQNFIAQAISLTASAFERVLRFVRPGVTENQVQAEIEHQFRYSGATGNAFAPIAAAGKNACTLHYSRNSAKCDDGSLLLLDFGAQINGYAADISRTIPINGKFTARQRQLYELVLNVQRETISRMTVGTTLQELNKFTGKLMEKALIKAGLLDAAEVEKQDDKKPLYKKYYMHSVAHHLGIEVHDAAHKYEPLAEGMVLTCEPGIYIPEESTGIRIEDDILITNDGPVILSSDIPVNPDDIEKLMKNIEI